MKTANMRIYKNKYYQEHREEILDKAHLVYNKAKCMRARKLFTVKNLKRLRKLYNDNFDKLYKAVGTRWHDKYVALERKLNKMEIYVGHGIELYGKG